MPLKINHRPKTLAEVVGQPKVVAALTKLLEREVEDIPHALLFVGPRGTGKTTLARIVARQLGCHKLDFIEMNTADFRGIDTSRDINKNMNLMPMGGDIKVYFFDEVHGLTKDAQEALLKAIEEPPAHVFFIAGTTDPQKLIPTFRDRFKRATFETQSLPAEDIELLIQRVMKREGLDFKSLPLEVVDQIIVDCNGSARAAVALLDTVVDLNPTEMLAHVKRAKTEESQCIELCRALVDRSPWKTVATLVRGLQDDPERVRRAVLEYCSKVLLNKEDARLHWVMLCFKEPFFNTGKPGLTMACYESTHVGK